ncbi:MAG: 50S ribosomal protein L17 [Deltaproteobacteria bacterium]|nr:50S ribosomal protein L17 [Deltaproteobacteria bacterium]
MRHQKAGRKLGRTSSHRKAMLRNMLASFFQWEKIETTVTKAKELRPLAEKVISLGKRGDLHARRQVLRLIPDSKIVHKLFEEIAPKYQSRLGGYTRIIRTGFRPGDRAPLSVVELVEEVAGGKKKKGRKKKSAAKPAAEATPESAAGEKADAGGVQEGRGETNQPVTKAEIAKTEEPSKTRENDQTQATTSSGDDGKVDAEEESGEKETSPSSSGDKPE